jgi:hypothetical protein
MADATATVPKKPIYKKWWFWLGILFVLFLVSRVGKDGTAETAGTTSATSAPAATDAKPKAEENDPEITLAEFDKIKEGMTPSQVAKIVGGTGKTQSSGGSGEYAFESRQYDGDAFASNAIVTYMNGKVSTKAQFGLE